ncbi:hypothetical protein P43SY_009771 [Pythium insidiosum]|uniref:Uncharacterized protein n=1 Tax=Pythium insidiosum TaxID=114742 RepID=A0AAD5Q935_PYTIN|nr:hypothetical protein P43SY_009771 [Pythium insidiosum]
MLVVLVKIPALHAVRYDRPEVHKAAGTNVILAECHVPQEELADLIKYQRIKPWQQHIDTIHTEPSDCGRWDPSDGRKCAYMQPPVGSDIDDGME